MIFVDDTSIYNCSSALDFLSSFGMNREDIAEFFQYLSDEYYYESAEYWQNEAKEWEKDSTQQYEARAGLIQEIQDIADKLASGKGGTKIQYAEKLRKTCEYWA